MPPHRYRLVNGVSKPSAGPRHRAMGRPAASEVLRREQYQQFRRQQNIGSSAVSANSHLRSTHSCRMSGSRRGHLHTQHNTMRTVTHHFKRNAAQPTYRCVCNRSLTHSYRQAHGKSKPLAGPRHRTIARSTASTKNRQGPRRQEGCTQNLCLRSTS